MADERTKKKVASRYDSLSGVYDMLDLGGTGAQKRAGVRMLAARDGDVVLDLGCGTGAIVPLLAKSVSPSGHVFAVDISKKSIARLKKRLRGTEGEKIITPMVEDAEKLSFPDRYFDRILATYTFTSATDLDGLMQEAVRVLKDDGMMVILDTGKPKKGAARLSYPILKTTMRLAGRTYIDRDVLGAAKRAGLETVRTTLFDGGLVYCILLERAKKGRA
jgi:ubiquinone/menaquinone biosynthesis C-methylase UbiE